MNPRPLEGIKVIDNTHVLAGPYCTYQLSLLGADVIKIESLAGDMVRMWGGNEEQLSKGLGTGFVSQNAGKRSVCVDIRQPAGTEVVLKLAGTADVFVENYRPGALAGYGLGFEQVLEHNPKIVYASITAFGQTGPFGDRPGFDDVVQASSGFMASNRREQGPIRTGGPILDYATGMHASQSILAGLMLRDKTGEPQRIDIAMQDVTMLLLNYQTGETSRVGARPPTVTADITGPMLGRFPAKTGFVMLAGYLPRHCRGLARAMGLEQWVSMTFDDFSNKADQIQADVERRMLEKTDFEWDEIFHAEGVVGAAVRELGEVFESGQPKARNLTQPVDTAAGEVHVTTGGYHINGDVFGPTGSVPQLGQHTREVLTELGYNDTQIADLLDERTIRVE